MKYFQMDNLENAKKTKKNVRPAIIFQLNSSYKSEATF